MILIQRQKYSKGKKENGLLDVSGSRLAKALGISVYTPRIEPRCTNSLLINYGCSNIPWLTPNHHILNKPEAIGRACNKISTFKILYDAQVPIPFWCRSKHMTTPWFEDNLKPIIFCRTLINSSKGRGIVVARKVEELVDAPLYTLYIPKDEEYRFHVFNRKVIHIQKKLKLTTEELEARGITSRNPLIRNSSNGYVFSSNLDLGLDEDGSYINPKYSMMTEHSISAVNTLGLDFGAVDLIVAKDGRVYVLEVNTAPGIEGVTLEKYVEAFQNYETH
jgi:hypothetical protein